MTAFAKRDLPSIERLLADPLIAAWCGRFGIDLVKSKLRDLQQSVRAGAEVPAWSVSAEGYADRLSASLGNFGYRPVFNLTGTIIHTNPAFRFQTIPADPDDNAFADCAIAAHADFVLTDDRDYRTLRNAGYKPQPISPEEFVAQYL